MPLHTATAHFRRTRQRESIRRSSRREEKPAAPSIGRRCASFPFFNSITRVLLLLLLFSNRRRLVLPILRFRLGCVVLACVREMGPPFVAISLSHVPSRVESRHTRRAIPQSISI